MDTFIVRIYRRIAGEAPEPAGTIEHVESGERVGFADAKELLDRLLAREAKHDRSNDRGAFPCAGPEEIS